MTAMAQKNPCFMTAMAPQKNPCFSLLLLFSLSLPHLSSAANSIFANFSLSGTQNITSQDGSFVLGFFQPGNSSSQKYYIGIWYNKISKLTPVWVANRETPISDPASSELKISDNGNLVLLNESKSQIWSTNATTTSNSTSATLLPTGNLVLRDGSNSSVIFWQSFDNPTHTWLPGGKLRLDKLTGESQRLTSWKNSDDPAPGIFSLEIDPGGTSQYLIQWNRTRSYWFSGPWNNQTQIFSGVPEMRSNYIYSFQYVSNDQENYFTYWIGDNSIISRFIMDVSGQIKQLTWVDTANDWILFWAQPRAQCQVYALCGPYGSCNDNKLPFCNCVKGFGQRSPADWALSDQSGGCVRNTPLLSCGGNSSAGGEQDRFFTMPGVSLPDSPVSLAAGSAGDCAAACLNNCSCTAYSYDSGCSLWFGDLMNLQELSGGSGGSGGTLYLRLAASELPTSKSKIGMVAGVVGGVVVVLVALVVIVWLLMMRSRRRRFITASKAVQGALVSFRYGDLLRATKNFSDKLGAGGFGSVFKGMLPDSTAIAVKKLEGLHQGEKQFRSEVSTIGTIQHVNLVRLRGFCSEGTKRLLVYEHMPNGSLDTQLFQGSSVVLNWKTRYQIAVGVAKGLTYLHEQCREIIIHCDIKPENILLDASFVPKVADFGLAKLVGRDFSRVLTTMRGTRGYLAPEWISGLAITPKADVYSYGMMLFEIISGRRNSSSEESRGKIGYFPKLAAAKVMEGDVIGLLDHRLGGDANLEELTKACKIAIWCIQDEEDSRPTMGQVAQVLEGVLEVTMPLVPRSLQLFMDDAQSIVYFSETPSKKSSETGSTLSASSQSKSISSTSSKE